MQNASLRDIQRLLTCMALLPSSLEGRDWGYQTMVIGALFLKILHPTVYARLRLDRSSLDEILICLSLEKPTRNEDMERRHRDWAAWAYAVEGIEVLKAAPVPSVYAEHITKAFGTWGDSFSWRAAHALFAEAFDSFTLPNP